MTLIYTVERYPAYWPLVESLWRTAQRGVFEIVSSELTYMEALVGPLKSGNATLEMALNKPFWGRKYACFRSRNQSCGKPPDFAARRNLGPPTRSTPPQLSTPVLTYSSPTMPASVV
jgi:hypothetical protein